MVFNENKEIIGTSNVIGEIYLEKNNKLTDKIFIESIFYEKKEIVINKVEDNSIILLKPKVNLLDEVEIDYKKKYIVLTAYYRIYNSRDDVLVSFVDAEVKYIIKKNSIQKKVLNFRIFDVASKDEKINPYWVDKLKKTSLFETLNSKFHLIKDEEKGVINIVGKKNNKVYGTIKPDFNNINNKSNIVIDITNETDKIIGTAREEYNNEELLKTTIKDLKYWSRINIRTVTPKYIKIDSTLKGTKKMFNKREIFIQSLEYVSKEEYKKLKKKGYKDTSVSHYTKEFWKNLEIFTPLDPLIEKQLNEILVERK
ncbi:hypothetical protein Lupro_11635 [Lutibacter profundi]|uniref:Uncharacterized protein n=2 Tax=Lutibacter profundi TaxID=1622118 RepID=A0A109RP63_9FLAO|nr:hypothetical protein Lupro_11635 [Lutibacter profundi]